MPAVARFPDTHWGGVPKRAWNGAQCYGGRGGVEIAGADPAPGVMELKECMDLCEDTPLCDAVQVQDYSTETGPCWLRAEVDVQDCYQVDGWVTYTKPSSPLVASMFREHRSLSYMSIIIGVLIIICLCLAAWYVYKKVKAKQNDNYALTVNAAHRHF
ncbi:unnamed protein product [Prorocentrum cordatum]|uniref:Apple domain-containing protein n=1 Tax=Prorocentrum cordatum TaxID=2364126 RepID=A0ABN9UJH8_9DINO|nr:unnamed protein product [Polarella glacialis]